jgi:hypothetical protein
MDIEESVTHLLGDGQPAASGASKGPFKQARIRVFPMFGEKRELEAPAGPGGHGGADPLMLEQLFSPDPPPDADHRAASHVDGAASVLVGMAGNLSLENGLPVTIDDLFPLSSKIKGSRGTTPGAEGHAHE